MLHLNVNLNDSKEAGATEKKAKEFCIDSDSEPDCDNAPETENESPAEKTLVEAAAAKSAGTENLRSEETELKAETLLSPEF